MKGCCSLRCSSVDQRPLWDRVEKLQPRPGSGSSSGSSNSSSQASPSDRFRPRCESPGTVLGRTFFFSILKPKKNPQKINQNFNLKKSCNVTRKTGRIVSSVHCNQIYPNEFCRLLPFRSFLQIRRLSAAAARKPGQKTGGEERRPAHETGGKSRAA